MMFMFEWDCSEVSTNTSPSSLAQKTRTKAFYRWFMCFLIGAVTAMVYRGINAAVRFCYTFLQINNRLVNKAALAIQLAR